MIDPIAPVIAAAEVDISAEIDLVWKVLTDIAAWPSWNEDVKSGYIRDPVAEGTRFRWRVGGGTITSTFTDVVQPRLLAWVGRMSPLGITAVHVWHLTPHYDSTFVRTEESWSGWLPRLLKARTQRILKSSIDKGLDGLKRECERRFVGGMI
jgi:uncharacterized protein YndB with AHSA1/START domain